MEAGAIKHIVAGVGLTESSLEPVREALRLGEHLGARVTAVHVAKSVTGEAEDAISAHLSSVEVPAGVTLSSAVAVGQNIAAALSDYAMQHDAQLICVGPRAHGFVERHITGGPAEQLVSASEVPILVSREQPRPFERVLVALDFSPASARALRLGVSLLEGALDAQRLRVLHVLSSRTGAHRVAGRDLDVVQKAMKDKARAKTQAFLEQTLTETDVARCEIDVCIGATGHQLVDTVEKFQPHLVCMGTIGRRGLRGLLAGNTAERMVQTLSIPLLVAYPPKN